jgi:hypothetical protein
VLGLCHQITDTCQFAIGPNIVVPWWILFEQRQIVQITCPILERCRTQHVIGVFVLLGVVPLDVFGNQRARRYSDAQICAEESSIRHYIRGPYCRELAPPKREQRQQQQECKVVVDALPAPFLPRLLLAAPFSPRGAVNCCAVKSPPRSARCGCTVNSTLPPRPPSPPFGAPTRLCRCRSNDTQPLPPLPAQGGGSVLLLGHICNICNKYICTLDTYPRPK